MPNPPQVMTARLAERVALNAKFTQYQFELVQQLDFPIRRLEQNADVASTLQRVRDADPNSDSSGQLIDTSLRLYYKRQWFFLRICLKVDDRHAKSMETP